MESEGVQSGKHVVVLVHGIRDFALWQSRVRDCLEEVGFAVELTNYGRLNLIEFLAPLAYFRRKAIDSIVRQLRIIATTHPNARISIIAHSFGTYVVANILKDEFGFEFHRIIFCGSVLKHSFNLEASTDKFTSVLNEVGTRDVWPAMAESVTVGYGSAGTYGFRRAPVRDRWHNEAAHGYFLDPEFCRKFWVPYLLEGIVVPASKEPEDPKGWVRVISIVKIKYLLAAAVALAFATTSFGLECSFGTTNGEVARLESAIETNLASFPSTALQDAKHLVESCPRRPNAWRLLGKVQFWQGERGDALGAFTRGLDLNPEGDVDFKLRIGKAAGLIGQNNRESFEEAEHLLMETMKKFPQRDLAWKSLAVVRLHLGDIKDAKAKFGKQLAESQSSEESAFAHVGMGTALLKSGDPVAAIQSFKAALCRRPDLRPFFTSTQRKYLNGWEFETFRTLLNSLRGDAKFDAFLREIGGDTSPVCVDQKA
jgi:tetratricopeptide (TPR) repeat protein